MVVVVVVGSGVVVSGSAGVVSPPVGVVAAVVAFIGATPVGLKNPCLVQSVYYLKLARPWYSVCKIP